MPMGKTISFVKGKGSISHNNRDFIAENVDRNRTAWNVEYIKQPIREAYNQLFGEAIAEYNAKQKRKDRQVTDYLKDIKNSGNGEKQFYEIVVQIGKKDDTGVMDSVEEFKEFVRPKSIKERMVDKQKRVETQKKQTVMKHVSRRKEDIAI